MRNSAEVVIIGGGVIGVAVAYHLAKQGCRDVLVLERDYLASGATGRCGAGVRQQWGTEMNLRMSIPSVKMFESMNHDLEYDGDIEFKQGGYLLLAYTEVGWEQFQKNVALQQQHGLGVRLCTPEEAKEIVPHLNTEGLVGATYNATDGHCNPFHVTDAYAKAARRLGVEIQTFTEVTAIRRSNGQIVGVETTRGPVATKTVVNAGGAWSGQLSAMAGVEIPVRPERHQILVTEPVAPMQGPMVMSFHHHLYCQQTPHGSFIMGLGDPSEVAGFNQRASWQFLEEMAQKITWLLPPLRGVRVVRQWSGLYEMTPDRTPILGGVSGVEGLFLATGFSGHGFMLAPMTGVLLAEAILGLPASLPIEKMDLGRFARGELFYEPSVV
ncbi:MAG: Sarcosine oxidase subunit beta [Firmicutes bacterium]|nr:Sarcosine oxidase subunit beta [Bacillota bacterium]MBT9152278.1 Sarcosine oxidase subunit beta [Bacillota bacterium]MBT9157412.1 Sarcosine oxidase subunit beta [Bacillota bacterium]